MINLRYLEILSFLSLTFALFSLGLLIFLCKRVVRGKTLRAFKLLTVSVVMVVIQTLFNILNLPNTVITNLISCSINFIIILFIFLAILVFKLKVDEIDGTLKKKLKRK